MRSRYRVNICVKWKAVFHNVEIVIVVNSDHRLLHSTRINTNGSFHEPPCFHCNSFQYQAIKQSIVKGFTVSNGVAVSDVLPYNTIYQPSTIHFKAQVWNTLYLVCSHTSFLSALYVNKLTLRSVINSSFNEVNNLRIYTKMYVNYKGIFWGEKHSINTVLIKDFDDAKWDIMNTRFDSRE